MLDSPEPTCEAQFRNPWSFCLPIVCLKICADGAVSTVEAAHSTLGDSLLWKAIPFSWNLGPGGFHFLALECLCEWQYGAGE